MTSTSQCKPCEHRTKLPCLRLCLFRVCQEIYKTKLCCQISVLVLSFSQNVLVSRPDLLDMITGVYTGYLGILSLWACFTIKADFLPYYNATWKSHGQTQLMVCIVPHFGEGQVIACTEAERKSDSARRGCVCSEAVSLWDLELLFEIACCPTRLTSTSLLSQHAGNGAFPSGQDIPVQKLFLLISDTLHIEYIYCVQYTVC